MDSQERGDLRVAPYYICPYRVRLCSRAPTMTKEWISLAVPWLFVTNTLLFLALSAIWFLRARRTEAVLFLWAAIGFALGAVLLLD
jgi:hypothetical protein